jgi:membrane protein YdbS with pleckstrin-like domain
MDRSRLDPVVDAARHAGLGDVLSVHRRRRGKAATAVLVLMVATAVLAVGLVALAAAASWQAGALIALPVVLTVLPMIAVTRIERRTRFERPARIAVCDGGLVLRDGRRPARTVRWIDVTRWGPAAEGFAGHEVVYDGGGREARLELRDYTGHAALVEAVATGAGSGPEVARS